MHIKRFEGSTLAELLEKIRAELGEDALILETRTGKRGRVEVLAARPHANDDQKVADFGRQCAYLFVLLDRQPPKLHHVCQGGNFASARLYEA